MGVAGAASVTLNPSQDTFISEYVSFANPNGTSTEMVIGTQGANVGHTRNRGLIQFDLSSIPPGAVVSSVTLSLRVTRVPLSPANSDFHLHRLLQPWDDLESTWPLRLDPDENWGTPGGQEGLDYSADFSGSVLVAGAGDYTFVSTPELVADVSRWLTNSAANHGWLVKTTNELVGFTARRFASREGFSGAPVLEVQFEPPSSPLRIHRTAIVNGEFCLSFNAQARGYIVERRDKADEGEWTPIWVLPAGDVPMEFTVCDPLREGNRFYRVREM